MARDVAGCAEQLRALVPELEPAELGEPRVGIAWLDAADPLVRQRVEQAAAFFPDTRQIEFPLAARTPAVFMREVADVHRELYAEHGDLYGENIRPKIERCVAVSDAEYAAASAERERVRERALEAVDGLDLLLTPTLAFVAPPADVDEIAVREGFIRFTYPFNALGWPALALPCGAAEDGLPASVQIVGRPGDDARVLAAGAALEAALKP
jgi:Asp-tRNA(Asn)/Glu-tRNA(Gln) amidotransferase A subunit family amidase